MKTCITLLFLASILTLSAQNPAIIWQNTIGGNQLDKVRGTDQTTDGGTILAGVSLSGISGEKTESSNGGADIWVIKLDADGTIEWQNTIGGNGEDFPESIQQTADGGYIIGAASASNISGDKSENSRGGFDYWIIKLDNTGALVWQKTYGGVEDDSFVRVIETTDGGYIASGYSNSSVSGDKTDPSNGNLDIWVIKMDNNGAIQWQNSVGGNGVDRPQSLIQTNDGGYLTGGLSDSNVSGDKTQPNIGSADWWVVKLNASGTIAWEKTFGGTNLDLLLDAVQTFDGGYLLGGYSRSGISGDKTEPNLGLDDYWIIKIDATGTIQWQNTIGGNKEDYFVNIIEEASGNFLLSGFSKSDLSGDKTDPSFGDFDIWILRTDQNGTILSQSTIGGSGSESTPFINLVSNNEILISGSSNSSISGDKTEVSRGGDDYWVLKVNTNLLLSVEDIALTSNFALYPNPTTSAFTIDLGREYSDVNVQIINMLGQQISSKTYASAKVIESEITSAAGVYFVRISTANEGSNTLRIIKQ